ncbi:MAG TPA: alpha/beta hydrolase [Candidatus Sulfotelmatobacter sp.]|nr:alpha/beta hydrolase [Candidatus Sulfotelmatobacter sp.]
MSLSELYDPVASGDAPADAVRRIEREARMLGTPCGRGEMVWRIWGEERAGRPALLMLHGGYGSWAHWIRNILPLSEHYLVIAPDSPGLGDSAAVPQPHQEHVLGGIIADGLATVLPAPARFHFVGFSFGCLLGGYVARRHRERLASLTVVGSGGLGLPRLQVTNLTPAKPQMSPDEVARLQRENLAQLMIYDRAKIDPLALHLQIDHTRRARVKSRLMSRSDGLAKILPELGRPLAGIWGEHDVTAAPDFASREKLLRSIDPQSRFEIMPGIGHWAQYEGAADFNRLFLDVLAYAEARS